VGNDHTSDDAIGDRTSSSRRRSFALPSYASRRFGLLKVEAAY
jgi:hypothetical protein